jgi:hypothetical protein
MISSLGIHMQEGDQMGNTFFCPAGNLFFNCCGESFLFLQTVPVMWVLC